MKKLLIIFFVVFPILANAQSSNDPKALQIVRGMIDKLQKNVYQGPFSMTYESQSSATHTGSFIIDGNRYKVSLGDDFILFDGKYHWSYSSDMNEVSVMEPSEEEMKMINPILMIESYLASYRVKFGEDPNSIYFFPLDAKQAEFFRITLYVDSDKLPVKLVANSRNGDKTIFEWHDLQQIQLDENVFVFDESKYPDVEINDLR